MNKQRPVKGGHSGNRKRLAINVKFIYFGLCVVFVLLVLVVSMLALKKSFLVSLSSIEPTEFVPQPTLKPTDSVPTSVQAQPGVAATRITSITAQLPIEVGKWQRFEVSFANPSWNDNPFDLEFSGVFTHVPSGRKVTQLGFYAGGNTWKLFFMPDELGEWTFITQSPDSDLNGHTGTLQCVASELPGRLVAQGNRWQLQDSGQYLAPIMLPSRQWFKRTNTNDGIDDFISWADETAGATIIGTTLVYFGHAQDAVPYVKEQEGEMFNIEMWDRLNNHFDALRDRGMGFYIMFYSDDEESPNRYGIRAQSQEELRLFRYAVARFSAYPIVMWDTGIDIGETRSDAWIDWFAEWFNDNDPWQHPVSSRTGGGSRGKFPVAGSYYSDGNETLPNSNNMINVWNSRSVPTAYTDRWRENYNRGNFTPDTIRQAAWQAALTGGATIYVSGDENGGYLTENYANDLIAAPYLGYRTKFFENYVSNYGALLPHNELVVLGDDVLLAANPSQEYVVYSMASNSLTLDLSRINGSALARFYDPQTGQWVGEQMISGGGNATFERPPGIDDWVIYIAP
ncbi:MAG: DUF5060 domain-containing protein [Ardenticatenaceae bacterium]|nr:DUF5060 domain-containing protein [Ardenticatenaceae bacterium]